MFGPWARCNAPCGAANRSRAVTCASAEGYLAQLSSCMDDPAGENLLAYQTYEMSLSCTVFKAGLRLLSVLVSGGLRRAAEQLHGRPSRWIYNQQ